MLLSDLENLFLIDPHLLPIVVHMWPFTEYETLFKRLPPFYSVSKLACDFQHSFNITYVRFSLSLFLNFLYV